MKDIIIGGIILIILLMIIAVILAFTLTGWAIAIELHSKGNVDAAYIVAIAWVVSLITTMAVFNIIDNNRGDGPMISGGDF